MAAWSAAAPAYGHWHVDCGLPLIGFMNSAIIFCRCKTDPPSLSQHAKCRLRAISQSDFALNLALYELQNALNRCSRRLSDTEEPAYAFSAGLR
jgi:hypothetical protein